MRSFGIRRKSLRRCLPTLFLVAVIRAAVTVDASPHPPLPTIRGTVIDGEMALEDFVDESATADEELVFVQALWRHGDRSPLWVYKADRYQADDWPQGLGELSPLGMAQEFRLGQKLRKLYVEERHYMSSTYKRKEIFIQSTDFNRTILSAVANMAGFFSGPKNETDLPPVEGWPSDFTPVPVHTEPWASDYRANMDHRNCPCKRLAVTLNAILDTKEYQKFSSDNEEFFANMSALCGEKIDVKNVHKLQNLLHVEKIYNRQPEWLTPEIDARLKRLSEQMERFGFGIDIETASTALPGGNRVDFGLELRRMRGGPLLWSFINQMRQKADCLDKIGNESHDMAVPAECKWLNPLRFYAFSAHDSTVSALSAVLTGSNGSVCFGAHHNPPYATAVTVEMWRRRHDADAASYYVKVLHWKPDSPTHEDITALVSGCEEASKSGCPLKTVQLRSAPYRPNPTNEKYCANLNFDSDSMDKSFAHRSTNGLPFGVLVAVFAAVVRFQATSASLLVGV